MFKSRFKTLALLSIAGVVLFWFLGHNINVQAQTPLRDPVTGSCECPYDRTSTGRLCGGNSSYSKAGGSVKPVCYVEDQPSPTASPSPSPIPTASPSPTPTSPPQDSTDAHLKYGNPSNATFEVDKSDNYLLLKPQYAISYNRSKGIANWVSWQLNSSWLGDTPRQDDFRPDSSLPSSWYRVTPTDYTNSGFDRGHLTSSEDRGATVQDNSATFLMTNIIPQSPDNNRGPWIQLETYCRELVKQGKELYVVAGGVGEGGTGEKGAMTSLAGGKVSVPASTWKVILVLNSSWEQVSETTRTIAVNMSNTQGIRIRKWQEFRVSVDEVEQQTGYDFFSAIEPTVQSMIEAKVDNQ